MLRKLTPFFLFQLHDRLPWFPVLYNERWSMVFSVPTTAGLGDDSYITGNDGEFLCCPVVECILDITIVNHCLQLRSLVYSGLPLRRSELPGNVSFGIHVRVSIFVLLSIVYAIPRDLCHGHGACASWFPYPLCHRSYEPCPVSYFGDSRDTESTRKRALREVPLCLARSRQAGRQALSTSAACRRGTPRGPTRGPPRTASVWGLH